MTTEHGPKSNSQEAYDAAARRLYHVATTALEAAIKASVDPDAQASTKPVVRTSAVFYGYGHDEPKGRTTLITESGGVVRRFQNGELAVAMEFDGYDEDGEVTQRPLVKYKPDGTLDSVDTGTENNSAKARRATMHELARWLPADFSAKPEHPSDTLAS